MDGAMKSHALYSSYVERKPLMTTKCKKSNGRKKSMENLGMGWERGWVMAFPLVSA